MTEDLTLEQAEQARAAARSALESVEHIARLEAKAASDEVMAKHAPLIAVKRAEHLAAEAALKAAKDRLPDHPWTGKRVYWMKSQGWSYERLPEKRVEGIVETYRSTSELPGNTAIYSRPRIGQAIVRALKKDGTPGSRFEILHETGYRRWKLCDEEQAK